MLVLPTIGIVLSYYMLLIWQTQKKRLCDISKHMSCSRAAKSAYSHIFWFHNARVGIAFYIFIILAVANQYDFFALIASLFSLLVSAFLAYIQIKEKNACLVCIATYIVNIGVFLQLVW